VTNAGPTTAVGGGVVTADNLDPVTARGLCWGAAPNPTLTNAFAASGSGTGVFSGVTIAGLPAGTYHARAWATNAAGAAYGADAPFAIGTLTGDFTTGATNRFIPISNQILFTSAFSGANTNPLSYFWDFEADGVVDAQGTNLATIIHTYVQPGLYSVRLTVSNSWGESVVVTHAACLRIATMHFVSPYGTHQAPYTNWTTAATNPAAAVAAAADYDTVLVTNGTYAVTAQISVDTGVQILSVNGAVATTIRRADTAPWCRIFRLNHARAVVDGFTIANGVGSDGPWQSNSGGGVMCLGGATLRNCILTGNTASEGGGVYCDGGLVLNCVLAGNSATIAYGGGISCQGSGIVRNCLVTRNSARIYGGGIHLQNGAQAQSCTVAGNTAGWNGGGLYCFFNGETVTNSIIWGNTAPADANWGTNGTASFGYCCTLPAPPGAGHVTNAPAFVDPSQDDYRLTGPFAGIDGGTNQAWMAGALDLAGNGRIWRGTVDMGAYEEGPLICSIVPDRTADLVGSSTPFQFLGTVAGQNLAGLYYRWDFQNDGAVDAQGPTQSLVSCLYPAVGRYSVRLTVSNGAGEVASNLKTNLILVAPLTNFVSTTGSALFPYTNWSTAAREIAAALGAAFDGTTVLVSNGTYSSGAEVQIANAIAVRGVNGAACTVVDRGGAGRGFRLSHSNAVLEGLTIRGGFTSENGGGVRIDGAGTVRRCILRDNHANNNGGGVYLDGGGRIESCLLIRNWAWRGGGVYGIGGTVENGTIAANSGMDGGGFYGVGSASVTNTIIQFNTAPNGANYYTGGPDVTYGFCCAQPALAGSGNVTNDPQFADTAYDNYRLWTNSPCLNAGTNRSWMAAVGDLDGRPRLRQSVVEMGAYESSGLFCRMDANKTAGTVGLSAAFDFTADVYGAAPSSLRFFWDFEDDGTVDAAGTGLQAVSHAYAYPAIYSVSLTVTNGAGDSALARRLSWIRVAPTQLCVWAGGAQTYPYTNWATAARSIQTGVDGAYDGTVVLVADGAYAVAAPVLVTNAIRVCSVSGAAAASVDGGYPARSNGCFSLSHTGAVVDGFSIQHGAASQGGGVRVAAGTVQNCRIVGNYTWSAGGGAWVSSGGLLRNCAISNNTAMAPVLSSVSGGGVCVLNGGAVRNCLVVGNAATTAPGVAFAFGGGIYAKAGSAVRNCTVAGNLAQGFACGGGGTYAEPGAAVANSIVYFNVPNNAEGSGTWTACCALPDPGGSGNITNNPAFLSTGNYRLQASSPCIDSGASAGAPADDLDGTPRPLDGNADGTAAWDIGAYEFVSGTADTDQDGMKDGDELAAGTDPRDPASKLTLVSIGGIGGTGAGALLRWLSVAGKTYAIDATANRTEAFSALASNLAATAPTNAYVDATFTNAPRRFYRIRLQP
jgi:PKD repeat protein